MKKSIVVAVVLAFGALAAFATFVWPTEWRYDNVASEGTVFLVRTSRFSGKAEVLGKRGWKPMGSEFKTSTDKPLMSCAEYEERKQRGKNALLYADITHRLPTDCPSVPAGLVQP